jgi:hypothetical protein
LSSADNRINNAISFVKLYDVERDDDIPPGNPKSEPKNPEKRRKQQLHIC